MLIMDGVSAAKLIIIFGYQQYNCVLMGFFPQNC